MNFLVFVKTFGFLLLVATSGMAQTFDQAMASYQNRNYEVSYMQFEASAQQGYHGSFFMLAGMNLNGLGVQKNPILAAKLYTELTQLDSDFRFASLFQLGTMYIDGIGVIQDRPVGVSLVVEAGNAGYLPAQSWLGSGYYQGWNGFLKDNLRAEEWLYLAAVQGDKMAQTQLGYVYFTEFFIAKLGEEDAQIKGMKWLYLARANGMTSGLSLEIYEDRVGGDIAQEAKRLAQECLWNNYVGC